MQRSTAVAAHAPRTAVSGTTSAVAAWQLLAGRRLPTGTWLQMQHRLLDHHRLDVHELLDAVVRALTAEPALLDAPERQPRVRFHEVVDKRQPGVQLLRRDAAALLDVAGEDGRAQAEAAVVRHEHGLRLVLDLDDGGNGAEDLLLVGHHPLRDVREDGHGVEGRALGALGDLAPDQHLRTTLDRVHHLAVHLRARLGVHHRAHPRLQRQRVPDNGRAHLRGELLDELVVDRLRDDEPLRADAALPAVQDAAAGARGGRQVQVGVGEDQVRVGPAELQHRLLEQAPRVRAEALADGGRAGQGHGPGVGVLQHGVALAPGDGQVEEHVRREARLHKDLLDGLRAAEHVGGVLQEHRVAGGQAAGRLPEHLPEWEIPGHHDQDHAERVERHEALGGLGRDVLRGQEARGVVGVVVAHQGALLDLRTPLFDALAHLIGHELRELVPAAQQHVRGGAHQSRARLVGRPLPRQVGGLGPLHHLTGLRVRQVRVLGNDLPGGGAAADGGLASGGVGLGVGRGGGARGGQAGGRAEGAEGGPCDH
mmetsp:Transcript_3591/g.6901  ORF Transcript_3591/g.6901 Transcript_3591/m.6901 type:complete len:538 (+) Transcript_3591:632-2245(+)